MASSSFALRVVDERLKARNSEILIKRWHGIYILFWIFWLKYFKFVDNFESKIPIKIWCIYEITQFYVNLWSNEV